MRPRRAVLAVATLVITLLVVLTPAAANPVHRPVGPSFGTALRGSAPTGHGPSAMAVDDATDTLYVANGNNVDGPNAGGTTVSVIDGRRCSARTVRRCAGPWPTVTVGHQPSALAVDPTTHTVYVTNIADDTVSVVDGRTCNSRDASGCDQTPVTVRVGSSPSGLFADQSRHTLYVSDFDDDSVSIIDTDDCNATRSSGCPTSAPPAIAVGDGPGDVDVNQVTHTGYVTTLQGLTAFDTATCNATTRAGCRTTGTFTLCTGCYGAFSAKVDPATNTIYEGDGDTSIAAIDGRRCDADDLRGCATAPFGLVALHGPFFEHVLGLAVDSRRHTVYGLLHKGDVVVVLDARRCNGARVASCGAVGPRYVHTGSNPEALALDRRTRTLYVADEVDDTVSVIDAGRCSATTVTGCRVLPPSAEVPGASAIAVDTTTGTAYVTAANDAVAMIDTHACHAFHPEGCGHAAPTVAVGTAPVAIAIDVGTHTAYVANGGDEAGHGRSLSVLDTRTCHARAFACTVSATVPISVGSPTSVAVNHRTHAVYVGAVTPDGADVVLVLSGAGCDAETSAGCGQTPSVVPLGPPLGASEACGSWHVDVAVDARTSTVYATNVESCGGRGDTVYVLDGVTCGAVDRSGCGAPVASIKAGNNPYGLAVDEDRNTLYAALVADYEHAGGVAVIEGATCSRADTSGCGRTPETVPTGFGSTDVAVDPLTHRAYVADLQDASVTVIGRGSCTGAARRRCRTVTRALPVDDYPASVAVDPTVRTAYVTSPVRGTVSVVRLSSLS